MYDIEDSEDLGPLRGLSFQTAEASEHELTLRLDDKTEIQIEKAIWINDARYALPVEDPSSLSRTLHRVLVGKKIVSVFVASPTDIELVLQDSTKLRLDGGSDEFECYSINGPTIDVII